MPDQIAFADDLPRPAASGGMRRIASGVQPPLLHPVRGGFAASPVIPGAPDTGPPPLARERP